jgi:endonuclease/exonuclease/phosphatase family metal-dependent hydrolase
MAGVHLLAKPLDQNRCGRREAQAAVIKDLVDDMKHRGDRIILAGDFNDYDNEVIGTSGDYSITRVLPLLKSGLGLVNTAASIPHEERYSCWFDKDQNCADTGGEEHTLIDHVLVSRDWPILEASFHHKYKVSCRERVSDHWPFKLVLDLA